MTDREQAKRVECALAGKTFPEPCIDCKKARTETVCTLCKERVCSKCQNMHRLVHQDRNQKKCANCPTKTSRRCRSCSLPICSKCNDRHMNRRLHIGAQYGGSGMYGNRVLFVPFHRLSEFSK